MDRNKIILSFILVIVCTWSTYVIGQTIGTPSPVNITNDGYNSAGVTDRGSGNALDVNILSGITTTVTGSVNIVSMPSITGYVTIQNPVTSVTTSALGTTLISGTVAVSNMVTSVTTSALGTTPVSGTFWQTTQPVSLATAPTTTVQGSISVSNMIPAVETGLAKDSTLTGGTQKTQVISVPTITTVPQLVSSITTSQITVSDTATLIKTANASRLSIGIRNHGTVNIYIGPATVTASNGILLKSNNTLFLDKNTAAIYGIVSSGLGTVGYIEE